MIIFGISAPDYPTLPLRACLYDYFRISIYVFCLLYIHLNKINFTHDKLETVKFGFSIFNTFSQVLLHSFTFLINSTKECSSKIQHSNSDYLSNKQTYG